MDLYLTKSGTLKRDENSLLFIYNDQKRKIPIKEVDSIFILCDINVNSELLEFLSKMNIPVFFYNFYGKYIGCYYPVDANISGKLLINQVIHYTSLPLRLNIAQKMVHASIHNMRKTLMQYGISTDKMEAYKNKIDHIKDIFEIMGYEGKAREFYYSTFPIILNFNNSFTKREKRPPKDPINAVISFGNSLLYNTTLSEIYKTALDPRISYLHEPFERRFSLNLDIADIFKPLTVDRVLFKLFNKKIITIDDFIITSDFCYLNESGRRKYISAYDEKMNQTIQHPKLKRNVSYRYLLRLESYSLIKHLLEQTNYNPFKIYW